MVTYYRGFGSGSGSRRTKVENPKLCLLQVLKELDSLCKDSSLTPEALKAVASRLFRHSQHLLDEFLMLGKATRIKGTVSRDE
jgi:hypothetical protein